MYVTERYKIKAELRAELEAKTPEFGFNGFGEATYYRTYSRQIPGDKVSFGGSVIECIKDLSTFRGLVEGNLDCDENRIRFKEFKEYWDFETHKGESTFNYKVHKTNELYTPRKQEQWADTVIRVVEGVLSIRKDWYVKHSLPVDMDVLDDYASRLSHAMFDMRMLAPGRGLYCQGTEHVYKNGSGALNNCSYVDVKLLSRDMSWAMDMLMVGCGVGFGVFKEHAYELYKPCSKMPKPNIEVVSSVGFIPPVDSETVTVVDLTDRMEIFTIPDSREGWVESLKLLLESYENGSPVVEFDYSLIRPYGAHIKGFGGTSSGPNPLIKLHDRVRLACGRYLTKDISFTRLCADVANSIGSCVVAGNVRRCLPKGTLISTGNGSLKLIEDIRTGDYVRTKLGLKKVTNVFDQGVQYLVEIRMSTDNILRCTPNHRVAIYSTDDWSYKKAEDLKVGDKLVMDVEAFYHQKFIGDTGRRYLVDQRMFFGDTKYTPIDVTEVIYFDTPQHTYDIEVEDAHHFTANGFVVHNSAEILLGSIDDIDFLNLKNDEVNSDYVIHDNNVYKCTEYHKSTDEFKIDNWENLGPTQSYDLLKVTEFKDWVPNTNYDGRSAISWMSNNTVILSRKPEFRQLPKIAKLITSNGEPGIMNLTNIQEHARFGDLREDTATGCNPCGEIPLESYELCNLSEIFPTRCKTKKEFYEALELASFYSSTVSLLPTHREETNEVVNRNHRIGVSISGIADWIDKYGMADCIPMLRKGYKIVRDINAKLAKEAGIPESIRVSCVKPSGSLSQLAGVSSGMHFPTFKYAIRRMRVSEGSELVPVLKAAGVPWEVDTYSDNTLVFEFPIDQGKTRPAKEVSAWEQFALLSTLQREWADNMVSCTIYFDPETEGDQLEYMLGQFAPTIKSVSMLPHTEEGAYAQMPYEGIDKEEYERRQAAIAPIDWNAFGGSDGQDSKFCTNDSCSILPVK